MSKGTQITLVKDSSGLFHPYNDIDYETARKIPVGEDNLFKLQRVRNGRHHRKYFALIKLGFENQDTYADMENFRRVMQMRAGFFDEVVTEKNVTLYLPKSISYTELDQTQFEELYDKVFVEISKLIGIKSDSDKELFQAELAGFA